MKQNKLQFFLPSFKFLQMPDYLSEDEAGMGRLLAVFAWINIFIFTGLILVPLILATGQFLRTLVIVLLIDLVFSITLYLVYRGKVRTASYLVVGLLWSMVTLLAFNGGGVMAASYVGYFVVAFLSGILLGGEAVFVTAGLSGAAGLLLVYLDNAGRLPPPQFHVTPGLVWVANFGFLLALSFLQYYASRRTWSSLLRVRTELAERTRTEKALRESEERYRLISENMADVILLLDTAAWRFVYVSPSITRLLGYSVEEAQALSPLQLVTPEAREKLAVDLSARLANIQAGDESRRTNTNQLVFVCKDGSLVPVEIVARFIENPQGGAPQFMGVVRDITRRKQAELELQKAHAELEQRVLERTAELSETKQSLEMAVSAAKIGLMDWHLGTDMCYYSPQWKKNLGYEPEEIENTVAEFTKRLHPDDSGRVLAKIEEYFVRPYPDFADEFRMLHKDGTYHWISVQAELLNDENGGPVRFLGSQVDITERKQAELSLFESREDLRSLLEALDTGVAKVDRDGHYIYSNEKSALIVGATLENIANETFFDRLKPGDAEIYRQAIDYVLETGEGDINEIPLEIPGKPLRWLRVSMQPVFDQQGQAVQVVVSATDITEIKQAQERLEERKTALQTANLALENALRVKDKFLSAMTHELRTPLNSILGFSQILMMDSALSPEQVQQVDTIRASGEHLLKLINKTLDMSTIVAGHVVYTPTSFDPARLMHDMESMFHSRFEVKNLEMNLELDPGLPNRILSDEEKIKEILANLLENALKFTRQGGVILRCRTEQNPDTDDPKSLLLQIEVEDTGVGISPEDMSKLFKAYEESRSETQVSGGTGFGGLGLAICKSYSRLMGGDISVTSKPGAGSCFRVYVAVQEGEKVEMFETGSGDHGARLRTKTGRLTSESMAMIPPELIDRMKAATKTGQFFDLLELIDKVSEYSPNAAEKLRGLANDFQYDLLMKLFGDA